MKKKLKIDGYKEIKSIAAGRRNSGPKGSKILAIETLSCSEDTSMDCFMTPGVELTATEVYIPNHPTVRIMNIYISPTIKQHKHREIIKNIRDAMMSAPHTIMIGDLNAKTDIPLHETTNHLGKLLDEEIENGEILPIIPEEYTRYDPANRNPSVLDIALTRTHDMNMIKSIQVLDSIGSDHRPVILKLNTQIKKRVFISTSPNFNKADWRSYRDEIKDKLNQAPPIHPTKPSIDQAIRFITDTIQSTDKNTIPRSTFREGSERTLPHYILTKIKEKRKLSNKLNKQNDRSVKPKINKLGKEIRSMIETYEEERKVKMWEDCTDKSPFGFYRLAKKYLNPKSRCTTYPLKSSNGQPLKTDTEKLGAFQTLYENIYTPPPHTDKSAETDQLAQQHYTEVTNTYHEIKPRGEGHDLNNEVTPSMIIKSLKQATNTAPGNDGVHYKHVRNLPETALAYLANIYTQCWDCCYFPDIWKLGVTSLLPKSGKDLSQAKSYRPITLLPVLGKTFERQINQELKTYLEAECLIPESQAGFRQSRSTQDKLVELTEEAQNNSKKGYTTLATFFDIEKAFDKLCHEGVALKFKRLGLSNQTTALLVNYLSDRYIRIRLNNNYSQPIKLKAGTPQGAILSPTIFNIWVGDLPQPKDKFTSVSQFADDMATWSAAKNPKIAQERLQIYNNELLDWCNTWKILLSPPKTQMIAFYNKRPQNILNLTQNIGGEMIQCSEEVTFLGIILDPKLNLRKHHQKLMKEAKRKTRLFAGITGSQYRPRANSDLCEKILRSMIIPTFYYAPTVTCIRKENMFTQQDQVILRAGRLALHAPKTTAGRYVKKILNLENSKDRTLRLAKNYITNPERSPSIKKRVENHHQNQIANRRIKSPLDVIFGIT